MLKSKIIERLSTFDRWGVNNQPDKAIIATSASSPYSTKRQPHIISHVKELSILTLYQSKMMTGHPMLSRSQRPDDRQPNP